MSEQVKFTPGPWRANEYVSPKGTYWVHSSAGASVIASSLKNEANAHLIAAAPDLYAALRAIVNDDGTWTIGDEIRADALAALARARGQS